jgi:hypothetical protein
MMLARFLRVPACVRGVLLCDLRVVRRLLVVARFVVLRRFMVMLRGVLMMVCRLAVMLSSWVGHRLISLDPGLAYRTSIQATL